MVPKTRSDNANANANANFSTSEEMKSFFTGSLYYLNDDAREQLPRYQYKGRDNSLMYKYLLSPLAKFCVDNLTPVYLAPNAITLFGLSFMISSYFIFWYYVPTLEIDADDPPPRWIFLFNCISMLIYQTLDNMDGKQAVKTGNATPLGLLFDHGCDAINSIIGSANWIIAMGLVPTDQLLWCFAMTMGPFCMFYIATWEEYYTGELILPIVNGPNEGLFGGAMLSLTAYFYGYEFWQSNSWYEALSQVLPSVVLPATTVSLRNSDLVLMAASMGFCQEIIIKSAYVTKRYGAQCLVTLTPLAVFTMAYLVIGWNQPDIFLRLPRVSMNLAMVLFVEMCTQIMLSHITHQIYNPWRWQLLPLLLLAILVGANMVQAGTLTDQYLLAYTWSMGAYLCMKVTLVIHEITNLLNIWCFDIVTPRERSVKQD
jgi:ethanolaminephosphotransferase